jgi:hypothetical protein
MASAGETTITFTEVDEFNSPISTYVYSELSAKVTPPKSGYEKRFRGRIDTLVSLKG